MLEFSSYYFEWSAALVINDQGTQHRAMTFTSTAVARGDPVQGALAELLHPLIYTQECVWRLITLFSSRRSSIFESRLMWIGLLHASGRCPLR